MKVEQDCPALGELDELIASVEPELSPPYRKHARWIRGEIATAVAHGVLPGSACMSLTELLSPAALAAYCDSADRGELRRHPGRRRHPSLDTARARRSALKRLARASGRRLVVPPVLVDERERDDVTPAQERALWRHVVDAIPDSSPHGTAWREKAVRMAAVVAVTLDTRARLGELVAMTTSDLDESLTHLTVHRHPTNGPQIDETLPLSPRTRAILRQWLTIRAGLVERLTGAPPIALWTTVGPGGPSRIPGLPLSAARLTECYRMTTWALNEERAHDPAWVPLPQKLGALRTVGNAGPAWAFGDSGATGQNKATTAA